MTNKPSYLIAALLMMPVLASACDAVCQRMQRQQQRDMNYQMHLQETQRIQGQYNQGYSAPAPTYYPRYGIVVQGLRKNEPSRIYSEYDYPSIEMAEHAGITRCHQDGFPTCNVIFEYMNGCFALTKGTLSPTSQKVFSGFHKSSKWRARYQSMKNCRANATNCEIHGNVNCALPSRTPY